VTTPHRLKTAYFGRTNERLSILGLEAVLAEPGIECVSVTPGRGNAATAENGKLHEIARSNGIEVAAFRDVAACVDALDLVISFSNPVIFPAAFLDAVPLGIVNMHPAPLPAFRGCHAIEHAILEGAPTFGATMHYCDAGIDTGPVIDEEHFAIEELTAREVWDRVDVAAMALLNRTMQKIVDHGRLGHRCPSRPQAEDDARYFDHDSLPLNAEIDASMPVTQQRRIARAYDHPRRSPARMWVNGRSQPVRLRDGRIEPIEDE
jgi:methionyl-tRNA formyltransferase